MSELRFDSVLLRRMTAIGLPAGLATIMYSVANVIIQKAINLLGTDTAAAWSIYWKLDGFYWPISNAIGITVMTFTGQNYGARQLDPLLPSSVPACGCMSAFPRCSALCCS